MNWNETSVWALAAAMVFSLMHVADELWSRWDFGENMVSSSEQASLQTVPVLILGLWAFAWLLLRRPWGYAVALALALAVLWTGGSHFINTDGMTAFRWGVVSLEVLSALVLGAASILGLVESKPWSKAKRVAAA